MSVPSNCTPSHPPLRYSPTCTIPLLYLEHRHIQYKLLTVYRLNYIDGLYDHTNCGADSYNGTNESTTCSYYSFITHATLRQLSNISNGMSTLLPCVHPPLTLDVFTHVHYFVCAVDLYTYTCIAMFPQTTTVNIN